MENLATTLGEFFFKYRGFTPIPLIVFVVFIDNPTLTSLLIGVAVMLIGEWVRFWGVAHAGGATRTRSVGAPHLVTSGPFAYVRNPLYFGNMIMYAGAAVIANAWVPYLIVGVVFYFAIQYYFIVRLEEAKLTELFGDEYSDYMNSTPRFLPRLKPIGVEDSTKPDYLKALRPEKSTLMSFAAIVMIFVLEMTVF